MADNPILICCNLTPEARKGLETLSAPMRVSVRPVKPEEYACTVSYFLGEAPARPRGMENIPLPMLVFAGFSDSLLQLFLQLMSHAGIPAIPLKAVVTQANRDWSLPRLFQELSAEHRAMHNA